MLASARVSAAGFIWSTNGQATATAPRPAIAFVAITIKSRRPGSSGRFSNLVFLESDFAIFSPIYAVALDMMDIMYPLIKTTVFTGTLAGVNVIFLTCSTSIFLPQICMFSTKNPHFCKTCNLFPQGQRTSGGRLIKIASILPPVFKPNKVPRSCSRLNST